ncbi:MAG TPA: septal ring lytic transglycosylase RlpA family protein [Polyangia bacterium]|jgi:rare lipoprotein A|nr:septal ring lytic transglycosylase RlpA family protein [Polyangia bacterium]
MRSALVIFRLTRHAALLALVLMGACAGPAANLVPSPGESVEIRASYYSRALVGRKTASGEPYDPELLTASHASLPMGTILRVTRLPDGPSVEVRVNDRCGCTHGRQLDLSEAAARQLNMLRMGAVKVRIELVDRRPAR